MKAFIAGGVGIFALGYVLGLNFGYHDGKSVGFTEAGNMANIIAWSGCDDKTRQAMKELVKE